jgi:prophage antirepressor-like protein
MELKQLPDVIQLFPGFKDKRYFQDIETLEFWFHATNVCKTLGFANPTSALALHCDEDERRIEIVNGKATWFVSEAGCYGLAMGAKNDIAKNFKRWLKHDVLKKLRADGGYIQPTATSEQIKGLEQKLQSMQKRMAFFGHDKKTVFNMFKILVKHNGMSDELIEVFKPFTGGKRFTIDEFESLIPASVKLPWKDDNV